MTAFEEATVVEPAGADRYAWTVPAGWAQGRGAWGGLVVGALVRAVLAAEPDPDRSVRSVSAEIAAPARVGPLVLTTELVRRGSSLAVWGVRAQDVDGQHVARLTAVLSPPRPAPPDCSTWDLPVMPDVPPASEVAVVPLAPPLAPEFMQHLHMRPVRGLPVEGGSAEAMGWVALAEPSHHTAVSLLAIVDAWWPASLPALREARPLATVNFSANLNVDPGTVPMDEALLSQGFVTAANDGFSSEVRRLWSPDGRLLVDNLQSIVLIA